MTVTHTFSEGGMVSVFGSLVALLGSQDLAAYEGGPRRLCSLVVHKRERGEERGFAHDVRSDPIRYTAFDHWWVSVRRLLYS
jgi:hypothetical protein